MTHSDLSTWDITVDSNSGSSWRFPLHGCKLLDIHRINYVDVIEIFFPLTLILLIIGRKLLKYLFSEKELCILDDPLPPWKLLKKGAQREVAVDEELANIGLIRSIGLSSKETYVQ
ncbi:hypothetical protein D918_03745 [Trichuris suis]|nr:hypothetical protein D918_03745 [Trichuris suis]